MRSTSPAASRVSLFTPSPLAIDPADPTWAVVDYMFRALAGIWFALICLALFGMGVGRSLSLLDFTSAPGNSLGALVSELVLPPILVLWQRSVARAHAPAAGR